MLVQAGMTLVRIVEKTPGGILVFFPSYQLMDICYDNFVSSNVVD